MNCLVYKMTRSTLSIIFVLLGSNGAFGEELSIASNDTTSPLNQNGFGYELIQSKLDYLEYRFSELFVQLKEQAEGFLINQQRVDATQQQLNSIVERHERKIVQLVEGMENSLGNNITLISNQSRRILELQIICSNHDLIRNSLFDLRPKNLTLKSIVMPTEITTTPVCSKPPKGTSGLCLMDIGGESTLVYKEQHRFGGNWLIVLQRFDGSENFNRTWTDYRNGFGTVGQEFWLGLEKLHVLTQNDSHEVLFEMEDFAGNYRYAQYNKFSVGTEEEFYYLKELGAYSGTAGDSFTIHSGEKFSALDKGPFINNVVMYSGGWWYYNNFESHLTGIWKQSNSWTSIVWTKFGIPTDTALKFARMMIRQI